MNNETEIKELILDKEKVYELKVGNINIEVKYSENNCKIDDCMINILKQKIK